ncbi:hypothetical protein DFAR_2520006 [Desulfarculales bacterium]
MEQVAASRDAADYFQGAEKIEATEVIEEGVSSVLEGRQGRADLHLQADSPTWVRFFLFG